MNKTAIILAGGKGTRLRPYTLSLPKPLVPLGDRPIIDIILCQLAAESFSDVIIALNHQADVISAYCGDGTKYGLKIEYYVEDQPLGTMGPLKTINNLPDDFLVMNGDILSDLRYGDFLKQHINTQSLFSISSYLREERIDYGVLNTENGMLIGFEEKPSVCYEVSMGIYAVNKKAINYIPANENFGFDNMMKVLLEKGEKVSTCIYNGYWQDIGRPEDYAKAFDDVTNENILIPKKEDVDNV